MLATRRGRLLAFFFLYVTEGVPLGFTATTIATQMRRQGVDPAEIGAFVGLLYLPWAWKWVAGPFVDLVSSVRFGRRRTWIVVTQILMAGSLLATMAIDFATQIQLFSAIILVHNIFGATQDVAIDALACETLEDDERGVANGVMFGGAYLGQAIGGAGVLFLLDQNVPFAWSYVIVVGAILAVLFFVSTRLKELPWIRERSGSGLRAATVELKRYTREMLGAVFGSRTSILGIVFALLPCGAHALSLSLLSNISVEVGLEDAEIARLTLCTTVLSATFCVLGGWLSDRLGRRRVLGFAVVMTTLPVFYFAFCLDQAGWIMPIDMKAEILPVAPESLVASLWIAALFFAVFQGLMYGIRTAIFMDITRPAVAATQFTAYMALLNVTLSYTAAWHGAAVEKWGYPTTFTIDACAGLLCLLVLPFVRPSRSE